MDLKPERLNDAWVIRLPAGLCFYESRAASFVETLGKIAEDLHRQSNTMPGIKGILLLQEQAADDRSSEWWKELTEKGLFSELVRRVDTWRWLLSLIRNSPVPWVYAAASDCHGSAWELALSCQRRYWYAADADIGFPEIAVGAFPPGGVLESLSKRAGRTRERWQQRPTSSASTTLDDGLIDFCSDAGEWLGAAKVMFQELLRVSPRTGVREQRKRRARGVEPAVDLESRRAAYQQLESVWKHEKLHTPAGPSAWDYCWQLVKERNKLQRVGDLGRLICLIASRHLLSPSYTSWLATELVYKAGREVLASGRVSLPPVVVDLNSLAPPTEVLVRLLRVPLRVVFVAAESKNLAVSLNLLFNRLERQLGSGAAQALWDRGVTWYQGVCDEARSIVLRWSVDDSFAIAADGVETQFLRLEGNGSNAGIGIMEWTTPRSDTGHLGTLTTRLASLVSEGIIRTTFESPTTLPVALHVRSLFLEEMLRITRHVDGDLAQITEALRKSGWHFAGDDDAWERFLSNRNDAYPFDAELMRLGAQPLDRANWEIGSWKHARSLAKRAGDNKGEKWNPTAISQHLALFLGLVAKLVVVSGRVKDRAAADYLAGTALGLPPSYGTPFMFLQQWGRRRIEVYARAHWPGLLRIGEADSAPDEGRVSPGREHGQEFESRI